MEQLSLQLPVETKPDMRAAMKYCAALRGMRYIPVRDKFRKSYGRTLIECGDTFKVYLDGTIQTSNVPAMVSMFFAMHKQ